MTVAVLGDARPPAKTQWPSAWSCSLKASIAAISSAVARSVVSKRTESRYCAIGIISCRRVAAPSGRLTPCYERRCLDLTRSAEISSRNLRTPRYGGRPDALAGSVCADPQPRCYRCQAAQEPSPTVPGQVVVPGQAPLDVNTNKLRSWGQPNPPDQPTPIAPVEAGAQYRRGRDHASAWLAERDEPGACAGRAASSRPATATTPASPGTPRYPHSTTGSPCTAPPRGATVANPTPPPAVLGTRRRLHRRHARREYLVLRNAGRPPVVGPVVGRPHPVLRPRRPARRVRPGHDGGPAAHRPGLARLGRGAGRVAGAAARRDPLPRLTAPASLD